MVVFVKKRLESRGWEREDGVSCFSLSPTGILNCYSEEFHNSLLINDGDLERERIEVYFGADSLVVGEPAKTQRGFHPRCRIIPS